MGTNEQVKGKLPLQRLQSNNMFYEVTAIVKRTEFYCSLNFNFMRYDTLNGHPYVKLCHKDFLLNRYTWFLEFFTYK